ncbi:MAG: hypothetical protein ABI435_06880 [Pseudolysinimonas sp.]
MPRVTALRYQAIPHDLDGLADQLIRGRPTEEPRYSSTLFIDVVGECGVDGVAKKDLETRNRLESRASHARAPLVKLEGDARISF